MTPTAKLVDELEDAVSIRVAMVIVPVLRILHASGHSQLADFLKIFGTDLKGDIKWILSHYRIDQRNNL